VVAVVALVTQLDLEDLPESHRRRAKAQIGDVQVTVRAERHPAGEGQPAAYDEHAVPAFDEGAVDFLLKPLSIERLRRTVARLQARLGEAPPVLESLVAELRRTLQRPRALHRRRSRLVPGAVHAAGSTSSISAGKYSAYVNDLFFGNNDDGEAGIDPGIQFAFDIAVNIPPVTGAAQAGYETSYFLSGGRVFAAGRNWHGELGNGAIDPPPGQVNAVFAPVKRKAADGSLVDLTGVRQIIAGTGVALALMQDSTVWAWGYNAFGQLADGTTNDRPWAAPIRHANGRLLRNIIQVSSGIDRSGPDFGNSATHGHVLALDGAGRVWAWGENSDGELANGNVWHPTGSETFDPFVTTLPQTSPGPTLSPWPRTGQSGAPGTTALASSGTGLRSLTAAPDGRRRSSGRRSTERCGASRRDPGRPSPWTAPERSGAGGSSSTGASTRGRRSSTPTPTRSRGVTHGTSCWCQLR